MFHISIENIGSMRGAFLRNCAILCNIPSIDLLHLYIPSKIGPLANKKLLLHSLVTQMIMLPTWAFTTKIYDHLDNTLVDQVAVCVSASSKKN